MGVFLNVVTNDNKMNNTMMSPRLKMS